MCDNLIDSKTMSEESIDGNKCPAIMNLNEHKAGLNGFDVNKINAIIHDSSKGSNFYSFQTKRQKRIDQQINEMKTKLSQMSERQRAIAMNEVNRLCQSIEDKRYLSRIIVHFDMDMFFAAVEMKDNPHLKEKPMAVGSDMMISTSNYIARQFGVRAAMPGFVAKQLCPQLILIKPNFKKYSKESETVMKIISEFDPNFSSFSLDEVSIDLTDYVIDLYSNSEPNFDRNCLNSCPQLPQYLWDLSFKVVQQIRDQIEAKTGLTASAGISCNTMIAKVCSDMNKPNGQFMVRGYDDEVKQFVAQTPVRKFSGIGPVRGQFLTALNIITGEDLWNKRDIIQFLFSQFTVNYYMRVSLGVGTTCLRSEDSRKSMSCERTFGEISSFHDICEKLRDLSDRLDSDLKSENQSCKTVTLKLKKISFEVSLKSHTISYYTNDSETIYNVAKDLLETELSNTPSKEAKYRLIGLKVSNLKNNEEMKSKGQLSLSQIFKALKTNCNNENALDCNVSDYSNENNYANDSLINNGSDNELDYYECSICSQTFGHKFEFECHENACIDEALNISANEEQSGSAISAMSDDSEQQSLNESNPSSDLNIQKNEEYKHSLTFLCPICLKNFIFQNNDDLNVHIDVCLNKNTCIALTQVPNSLSSPDSKHSTPDSSGRKRVRTDSKPNKNNSQKAKVKKLSNHSDKKSSQTTIDLFFHSHQ